MWSNFQKVFGISTLWGCLSECCHFSLQNKWTGPYMTNKNIDLFIFLHSNMIIFKSIESNNSPKGLGCSHLYKKHLVSWCSSWCNLEPLDYETAPINNKLLKVINYAWACSNPLFWSPRHYLQKLQHLLHKISVWRLKWSIIFSRWAISLYFNLRLSTSSLVGSVYTGKELLSFFCHLVLFLLFPSSFLSL